MKHKMKIIGDVHGKLHEYKEIVDSCESSICVGDFGFRKEWDWYFQNVDTQIHQINMGNHDYIPYVNSSLGDYCWLPSLKGGIFTVRGADSIDKHLRTEGRDWFSDEELSYKEGLQCFDEYVSAKPKIVISHDCPKIALETMFKMGWSYEKTNTRNLLQAMFEAHKPELWIFGHHHSSKDINILGTRFVCLDELETIDI